MRIRYWLPGLAAMLCLAGTAFASQTLNIDIDDFFYSDPVDTVIQHQTVTWTVVGFATHTTTSTAGQTDSWNSGFMGPGLSFAHTFDKLGTFTYRCSVHANMTGRVVVVAAVSKVKSSTWGTVRRQYRKPRPVPVKPAR